MSINVPIRVLSINSYGNFFFLVCYSAKLVLASFLTPGPTTPPHLMPAMKPFQTLFSPLAPRKIALSSTHRIVLVTEQNNRKEWICAVCLDEVGPRMEIRLVKITEAMSGREDAVIYHDFGTSQFVASSVTLGFVELFLFTQEDNIGY